MKIACDICEKVESTEQVKGWLTIKTNNSHFVLCENCSDKFWKLFDKDTEEQKKCH